MAAAISTILAHQSCPSSTRWSARPRRLHRSAKSSRPMPSSIKVKFFRSSPQPYNEPSKSTQGFAAVKIERMTLTAWVKSAARKKIQEKSMSRKVTTPWAILWHAFSRWSPR